ncbi:hypothetical protein Sdagh_08650 [Streptomyces daghestanicus]|uniref:Uncharacterized protein n=2 Tax=Streptomyces daghestanicus TaxID=66885 RepID=A0ABQ3PVT9_9ACTN|nr:hypothetical protein Sdagh_08650 [Streptomyces daghestanicus]
MTTPVLASAAELSEAEALPDVETGAPAATREALGSRSVRPGGGVTLCVRHDPTRFWSKALGSGFTTPVTAASSQRCAPSTGTRGRPRPSSDWRRRSCRRTGAKSARSAGCPSAGPSREKVMCAMDEALRRTAGWDQRSPGLNLAAVCPEDAVAQGAVMTRAFDMPEEHPGDMTAASVGRAGRHPFGIRGGTDLVAVGTMYTRGETAQFSGGATVPPARGGAQSALLAARARQADPAGCRWLVAETGVERPGAPNSSPHNMLRIGFQVLYERRNRTWHPGNG